MKKYLNFLIIGLIFLPTMYGCKPARDMSSPSTRIIGHWMNTAEDSASEAYFKPGDAEAGTINFTLVDGKGTYTQTWQILSEEKAGESITFQYAKVFPPLDDIVTKAFTETYTVTLTIPKDGLSFTDNYGDRTIYVDSKTEP